MLSSNILRLGLSYLPLARPPVVEHPRPIRRAPPVGIDCNSYVNLVSIWRGNSTSPNPRPPFFSLSHSPTLLLAVLRPAIGLCQVS